jgi:DNA polymerase-3 subunit beta
MKFSIQQHVLNEAVQTVSKGISLRSPIQILTGMKIDVYSDEIMLTGSDSDISIVYRIPKEKGDMQLFSVENEGAIVLPNQYFTEVVRKCPGEEITIETDALVANIHSGNAQFQLHGYNPEEYPRLPEINQFQTMRFPVQLLLQMIKQTVFAASTKELRPILMGIYFHALENDVAFVATDSHRLARRQARLDYACEKEHSAVIPAKSLTEMSRLLDGITDTVNLLFTPNQMVMETDQVSFYSRLLNGAYPDIQRIIPNQFKSSFDVETKSLLSAIERASLLAKESKNNVVELQLLSETQVQLTSNIPEIGKVTERVPIGNWQGEELRIAFNAKYMMDALKSIDSDAIKISFTGAMSPFILKPADHDFALHLILPVRIN